MKRFESFSIALLDQIESNVCVSEIDDEDVDEDDDENMKVSEMSGRDSLLFHGGCDACMTFFIRLKGKVI